MFSTGLAAATGDPTPGLYNTNASAPLEQQQGLRQSYSWGLYAHCAYEEFSQGTCSSGSFANKFTPFDSILADVPGNYTVQTRFIVSSQNSSFSNSSFLETSSRASFYLIFIGSLSIVLAMIRQVPIKYIAYNNSWQNSGIPMSTVSFTAASVFAVFGAVLLLVAASIWTAIIKQMQSINNLSVRDLR